MRYPFSGYSFIKRENGTWVSLGLLTDDSAGDFQRYDYTIPNSSNHDAHKAEKLAVSMLIDTAALVLPVQAIDNVKVYWKVSCEEVRDSILEDPMMVEKLCKASRHWEVCLMSDEHRAAFQKEIASGSETDTEA